MSAVVSRHLRASFEGGTKAETAPDSVNPMPTTLVSLPGYAPSFTGKNETISGLAEIGRFALMTKIYNFIPTRTP
jgi:hypothetical protein